MSRLNRLQHMALVKVIPQCDMANSTHTIHCCGISAAQQPLQFIGDLVCRMGGAHLKRAQTPWTDFVLLADPSALHHPYTLRHTYTHMRYCTLPPPPSNCQRDDTSGFGSSLKYATSSVAHRRGGVQRALVASPTRLASRSALIRKLPCDVDSACAVSHPMCLAWISHAGRIRQG